MTQERQPSKPMCVIKEDTKYHKSFKTLSRASTYIVKEWEWDEGEAWVVGRTIKEYSEGGKKEGKVRKGYFFHKKEFCPVCTRHRMGEENKKLKQEQDKINAKEEAHKTRLRNLWDDFA